MKQRKVVVNSGAVIVKDSKILLVQEANDPFRGKWNFPLGQIENNERVKETVIREVKEETGYDIELTHFLGVYQTLSESGVNVIVIMFRGKVVSGKLTFDKKELLKSKWFFLDEFERLPDSQLCYSEMRNVVNRALKNPRSLDGYKEFCS